MASFSAELHVAGCVFPVRYCTYGVQQGTQSRGQASTKVHYEPVRLVLDVPDSDVLLYWAATPYLRQAAALVFRNADSGQAWETLSLAAAYCVGYTETFQAGDAAAGAYVGRLTLTDPDGFTLRAGGPIAAFVAPAAREHGLPRAAEALEREVEDNATIATNSLAMNEALSSGLPLAIKQCLRIDEPEAFGNAVMADLAKIHATPTGRQLLESLANSGKIVEIVYSMGNNSMLSYDSPSDRFLRADGSAGLGTGSVIGYNPSKECISDMPWGTRPAAIGLAHELVHAEQAAYGRMNTGRADNDGRMDGSNPAKPVQEDIRELEAVGVPPQDEYPFSENKIRAEWNPPQPERKWY